MTTFRLYSVWLAMRLMRSSWLCVICKLIFFAPSCAHSGSKGDTPLAEQRSHASQWQKPSDQWHSAEPQHGSITPDGTDDYVFRIRSKTNAKRWVYCACPHRHDSVARMQSRCGGKVFDFANRKQVSPYMTERLTKTANIRSSASDRTNFDRTQATAAHTVQCAPCRVHASAWICLSFLWILRWMSHLAAGNFAYWQRNANACDAVLFT